MKKGLEELRNIDYEVIASKAHIVQTTLDDILNKRFDRLHPVKAKGFIKILERELDLDLSDWMQEFDAYYSVKEPEIPTIDKLNAEAIESEKKGFSKITLTILFLAIIGVIAYVVRLQTSSGVETNASAHLQNEINDTNANVAFNISFDANGSDKNGTKDANATEQNKTAVDVNAAKVVKPALPSAPVAAQIFYVEPTKKVWIGIRYMDTNKSRWFETVAEHRFDFNTSREQLIAFGHAQVKIVSGANTIESRAGGKIRYYYKDGKLREVSEEEYNKLYGKAEGKKEGDKPKQ
jgi:cytoskeletal protein RodZ